ncbi:hypothetical protein NDU88_007618 [Pleurodeles waltl]|uniref:Uncharacterized protein n=1 Tax=Pleurodeles waltl TaxID=8319 RepID=A0AAV7U105_PLEWA|nr:hypothetical protein NDU88_007618 [Pleurodeles waltl]
MWKQRTSCWKDCLKLRRVQFRRTPKFSKREEFAAKKLWAHNSLGGRMEAVSAVGWKVDEAGCRGWQNRNSKAEGAQKKKL